MYLRMEIYHDMITKNFETTIFQGSEDNEVNSQSMVLRIVEYKFYFK